MAVKLKCILYLSIISTVFISISGCATKFAVHTGYKGERTSVGGEINMGKIRLNDNWAFNGTVGFDSYKENSGYDTFVKGGVQVRRSSNSTPFWVGGELGYMYDVKYGAQGLTSDEKNNVFVVGGLIGSKLPIYKLDLNMFTRLAAVQVQDNMVSAIQNGTDKWAFGFWLGLEIALPGSK